MGGGGGSGEGISESARSTLRNMKEKLNGGGKKKPVTDGNEQPAPEGLDTTSFRRIQSVAQDQTTARSVREDEPLLNAFARADEEFGLHPIKLVRRQDDEEPSAEAEE